MLRNKSGSPLLGIALAVLAVSGVTGCTDDTFLREDGGTHVGFSVSVPPAWSAGYAQSGAPARCVSVTGLDGTSGTPLYLHTMVSDSCGTAAPLSTRGALVEDKDAMYDHFSLSGICHTGGSSDDFAPDFAFNLKYGKDGLPADGKPLLWPSGGQVRFFAIAPCPDGNALQYSTTASDKGAPKVRYTVPEDVKEQKDLLVATATATDQAHSGIGLNFAHVLSAIQIKAGKDMMAGTITQITLEGVAGTGTLDLGTQTWTPTGTTGRYTFEPDQFLDNKDDHTTGEVKDLATGEMTLLMIPQTLTTASKLTIEFTDKITNTVRTVSGTLGADDKTKAWLPGRKYTYTVSPSSIHVTPHVKISSPKFGDWHTASEQKTLHIPFSGVMFNTTIQPYIEVTQEGVETKTIYPGSAEGLTVRCKTGNTPLPDAGTEGLTYNSEKKHFEGKLVLPAQPVFATNLHIEASSPVGTQSSPHDLSEGGETANCYMVTSPGYYSLPLVYGNGNFTINRNKYKPANVTAADGMKYFAKHDNNPITQKEITGAADAVLVWQDSPDLVREVKLQNGKLCFQVDKDAIAQGNAVVAVRGSDKTILWSWHIWVTTPETKQGWTTGVPVSGIKDSSGKTYSYTFVPTNLGYVPGHEGNAKRDLTVTVEYRLPFPAPTGGTFRAITTVTIPQDELLASLAGDNPYYQWGRKDPMPPGGYTMDTPEKGNPYNANDMLRKPLFHDHEEYVSTRTPKTLLRGVSMGYTIQHPQQHVFGKMWNQQGAPDDFRIFWHNVTTDGLSNATYTTEQTKLKPTHNPMYNAWNSTAYTTGKGNVVADFADATSFQPVTKTVYDPCPPGFCVPPSGAFTAFAKPGYPLTSNPLDNVNMSDTWDGNTRCWMIKGMKFYAVGVRDTNVKTVSDESNIEGYDNDSWCSFRNSCYLGTASCAGTSPMVFIIDLRTNMPKTAYNPNGGKGFISIGANLNSFPSYGQSVRPIKTE